MHQRFSQRLFLLVSFALLLFITACGPVATSENTGSIGERQIIAVATTGMIADTVQQVGGERVQVIALMGPGVDPHLYQASEGDVTRMASADIIFYNGLHLEAAMTEVFERMHGRIQTVAVTHTIDQTTLLSPPEFEGAYDPHVWFDIQKWSKVVEAIRDSLIALDSAHTTTYQQNAERYLNELSQLDAYIKEQAQRVPPEQRVLITAHDAFNYFGKAYGFEVRGLQGISTATEAGTADVQALADFIAERQIRAIFVESSVPLRTIEAVQAAVRSRGFEVKIGGELFSDAMGQPGTPEGTYIGMLRHNIDTIVNALTS
jgi:manganese/zinc/iron transport system substrate-binding protein